ncbi:MAG: tyrosine-type recombinase/integrase [Edaphobacter sp.]
MRNRTVVEQALLRHGGSEALSEDCGHQVGFGPIGWHMFRHTYRSWLDEIGAPMKVQQELMLHASIQTTMNVYGQAMASSKREANSKVVEMVLKPMKASA